MPSDNPCTDADPLAEFNALVEFGEPGSVAVYVERLVNRVREIETSTMRMDLSCGCTLRFPWKGPPVHEQRTPHGPIRCLLQNITLVAE